MGGGSVVEEDSNSHCKTLRFTFEAAIEGLSGCLQKLELLKEELF